MLNPRLIKAGIAAGTTILAGALAIGVNKLAKRRKLKKAEEAFLHVEVADPPSPVQTPDEPTAEHGETLPSRGPDEIDQDESLDDGELVHGNQTTVGGIALFTEEEVEAMGEANLPEEYQIMDSKTGKIIKENLLHAAEELIESIAEDAPLEVDPKTGLEIVPDEDKN